MDGNITLSQPRPGVARRQNEYIETPLRPPPPPPVPTKDVQKPHCSTTRRNDYVATPITTQPAKDRDVSKRTVAQAEQTSIICRQCHRCRCEACRAPRKLPARWVCDNKCLCSASNCVDYVSCVCCVRACFYHWAKDHETDDACADAPCSCAPPRRWLRWACLGALAVPLPCLCLYWPLRGTLGACEAAYNGTSNRGCKCPNRTLLDDC